MKSLSSGQHCLHYKSMGKFFIVQGHETPKKIVWYGSKSLSPGHHCLHYVYGKIFHRSRASNSTEQSNLAWNRTYPRLYSCPHNLQIEEHPIKNESFIDRKRSTMGFFRLSRASNSQVKSLIWPKFELIREFMVVLVPCKFEDDQIKIECTINRTRSSMGFFSTRGQVTLTWIV